MRRGRELVGRVARRTLKATAVVGDRMRRSPDGVVVLIYHRVGGRTAGEIDLPTSLFDHQMAWLAETGRAVALDRALTMLAGSEDPPAAPPVVVTFDDGTADLVDEALPVLARHGVPATVYLATRHVDEGLVWPGDALPLSWSGAREMLGSGLVTFGSHTHGHVLLDRVDPTAADEELRRSRELIEHHLGVPADHFAYPKAVAPSASVEALVRRRFRSAALGGNRPNPYGGTDPHRLARTAVQVSDGMRFFYRKADGGMAFEDAARRAVNRHRYRTATT